MKLPRILSERQGGWLLSYYPPLFFQRIRVRFSDGFRSCRVLVRRSRLTRNLHGTTFGGAIFAAADPILSIMYWQLFARRGERVQAWLKSASIRYREPATTDLTLQFRLTDAEVAEAAAALDRDGWFSRTYRSEAIDRHGNVCALVETRVHLRRPGDEQREVSAF